VGVAALNSAQLDEITFISGVDADGKVAHHSYWDWNGGDIYSVISFQAKWGATTAGSGATVSVAFDPVSHWSTAEQADFIAGMDLWSAVANIHFHVQPEPAGADVIISRGSDGEAWGGITSLIPGTEFTTELGEAISGWVSIDTSTPGFGPIDGAFSTAGGYVWMTMLHELGHVLGLGHAGAYDAGQSAAVPQNGGYDTRAWSIMSYIDVGDFTYSNSIAPAGGFSWGSVASPLTGTFDDVPTTWMPLDIAAAQRLYGAATDSPLAHGGQVFGFHTNIQGDIAQFFDFTINTKPVITIWDGGANNVLDVSGFAQASSLSLEAGTFSSAGGLTNNIAIAFGTRIDTAIGGSANDTIAGNDDSDVLMGGAGSDSLIGGAGNDHIYGNMQTAVAGSTDAGDYIDVGAGTNYANGNAGNDTIVAGDGYNRLFGGQGDDHITVGNGPDSVNGNIGDDVITVGNGNDTIHGGQGNDVIRVGSGNDLLMGDLGNDQLYAGSGHDVMTGGGGADLFLFLSGTAATANGYDEITDFDASGGDQIALAFAVGAGHVLHDPGVSFADAASAAGAAATLLNGQAGNVAALQVGNDTYLFFNSNGGAGVTAAIHLDHVNAASVDSNYFV
jgi:serralysin